ncbi:hypothetical protein RFI_17042 [Reticulomyxa filosa]|uniref:Uncharacterized protein n=1 Tax=Reticulomyxa filosa TaxID=46433 RepID=X6N4D2_RETFI|nr:hypothetical protein RFI_17042 [Reticulomyxa filosa]|eukprot:ETO20177.1 hypothetical protein RFI_17042 [Reticulomyxa filosa]
MSDWTNLAIASFALLAVNYSILLCLFIYISIKFHKYHKLKVEFNKKKKKKIIVERPIHLFTGHISKDLNGIRLPRWADNGIEHTFVLYLSMVYVWRTMSIVYDYYFKESILVEEWKLYPAKSSLDFYTWVLEHKSTWGSQEWTLQVFAFALIFVAVPIFCINYFLGWHDLFIPIFIFILLELILFRLIFHMPCNFFYNF